MLVCIIVFRVERSSDQVIKPVNLEALTKWVGNIPDDVVRDMADIAPMLSVLGYDPYANPPAYGSPDAFVADNTKRIRANVQLWENRAKDLLSPQRTFQDVNIEDSASEAAPAPAAAWSFHLIGSCVQLSSQIIIQSVAFQLMAGFIRTGRSYVKQKMLILSY